MNNTAETDLRFFAGMSVHAPLIALLLAFFVAGFVFGYIALMPAWVRQRVELRRLRRVAQKPVDAMPAAAARAGSTFDAGATDVIQTVARGARTTT